MTEAQIPQNALLQDLECVICNESLCDPRALPCGHSYCGPPRTCLQSMEVEQGFQWVMKCAVCRTHHNLRADQINPLYGIRDMFPKVDTTDTNLSEEHAVHCATHGKLFLLWCKTCSVKICEDCLDTDHDEHCIKKLKRHLVEHLELKFGGGLSQKLQMRKTLLLDLSGQMKEIQEKCKKQMKALNEKLTYAQVVEKEITKELQVIEKYLDTDRYDLELETKLLLRLNDASSSPRDLSNTYIGQTMSSSCQTEYRNVTKSVEKASQYVSDPITFKSGEITLHVEQRNPLKVATVTLNTKMWGFGFRVSGTVEPCQLHKYSKGCQEKMFRITITNSNPNGSFRDVIGINYEVHLYNWVDSTSTISKAGSTIGGKNVSITSGSDVVLYSLLVSPARNWVNQDNNIKVSVDSSVIKIS